MTTAGSAAGAGLARTFRQRFGTSPAVSWAPGRVNLIGDHIDYCGGCVLPMPIQFGTKVALAPNALERVRASSRDVSPAIDLERGTQDLPAGHWARFVLGALTVSGARGGWDVVVSGDIPGSGLSSSASLSVALLHALGRAGAARLEGVALARAAQRIEHEFVGVTCGLMDQAVVALGAPGAAFLFDCAQGCGRSLRLTDDAHAIVVFDTGKVRALAASGYNARFAETARAAAGISIAHERLALASRAAVESIAEPLHRRRARHVVSEQARVHAATQAIEARDWRGLGALLDASHASLRDDFEVSCPELDLAASLCRESSDCLGARMTGGGFGGCVVALWRRDPEPSALDAIRCRYRGRTGLEPRAFVARSTGGVRSL